MAALPERYLPDRLASRYEPLAVLKEEADRQTLLLRDREMGEKLILKRSRGESDCPEEEYRLLCALAGDGIPAAREFFREGGTGFLLRAYVPGETLLDYMQKRGPLSAREAAEIALALCAILRRLHHQDPPVIHRDVKAENIIRSPDGTYTLVDFGIARRYEDGARRDTQVLGTPVSAPPEQFGFRQTDPRSDIYALGVLLREMTAGQDSGMPSPLRHVVSRCTRFDPADRYQSVEELELALRRAVRPPVMRLIPVLLAAVIAVAALIWLHPWVPAGPDSLYTFASPIIEAEVCRQLGKEPGTVTCADLERITSILLCGRTHFDQWDQIQAIGSVLELDGVPAALDGALDTLADIPNFPNLRDLALCGQALEDLSPLAGCGIQRLALSGNAIRDLSPLAECRELQVLYISGNPVDNLSPLAACGGLWRLNAGSTALRDLDSLTGLAALSYLELHDCLSLTDVSALSEMGNLQILFLRPVSKDWLNVISGLARLRDLYLWGTTATTDLTPLSGMTGLHRLFIDMRALDSLDGIEGMAQLEFLDVRSGFPVNLSALSGLTELAELNVSGLQAEDWSPLTELPALRRVTCSAAQEEGVRRALDGSGAELAVMGS